MGKKLERLQRMLVIINKLKGLQRYVPREELENYVTHRMEERGGMPVDLRTLQRDFNAIEEMFGIRICFTRNETDIISMKRMVRKKNNMKGSFSTLIY